MQEKKIPPSTITFIIYPDGVMPIEELREILDQNERASARTTLPSVTTSVSSPTPAAAAMPTLPLPRRNNNNHGSDNARLHHVLEL